jgi:hypothetical protein
MTNAVIRRETTAPGQLGPAGTADSLVPAEPGRRVAVACVEPGCGG